MPVATPVDVMPPQCEMRPFKTPLFVDANRTAKVKLPPGANMRHCSAAADGAQIITAPDSGGTEMCVIYEYGVDSKITDVVIRPQRLGAAKSRPDKSCPAVDYSRQGYPGKEWFFMSDNLPLVNALKVKETVEKQGLDFLVKEKATRKDRASIDYGKTPIYVEAIAPTEQVECRRTAAFFQGRYAACYRAQIYNQAIKGKWWIIVGLTKDNQYRLLESIQTPAPVIVRRKMR